MAAVYRNRTIAYVLAVARGEAADRKRATQPSAGPTCIDRPEQGDICPGGGTPSPYFVDGSGGNSGGSPSCPIDTVAYGCPTNGNGIPSPHKYGPGGITFETACNLVFDGAAGVAMIVAPEVTFWGFIAAVAEGSAEGIGCQLFLGSDSAR